MGPEYVVTSERMILELIDRAAASGIGLDNVQLRPHLASATFRKDEASLIVLYGSGWNVLGYDAPKQYPGRRPSLEPSDGRRSHSL